MRNDVLTEKAIAFAVRIIKLYNILVDIKKEYTISKQIIRSATSIGANITEANYGQSKADFISKMQIAVKEASETEYWLELLYRADYLKEKEYTSLINDCSELMKLLTATLNTAKN